MLGELHRVPISLGVKQHDGSLYFANFKVIDGQGYNILLGLDFLEAVDA